MAANVNPTLCAHCGEPLPPGRRDYCSNSHKTMASRARKRDATTVFGWVGFTDDEAVNIIEGAGMKTVTRLFTALGIGWDTDRKQWLIVDPERWEPFFYTAVGVKFYR